jgi:hypothetical protein
VCDEDHQQCLQPCALLLGNLKESNFSQAYSYLNIQNSKLKFEDGTNLNVIYSNHYTVSFLRVLPASISFLLLYLLAGLDDRFSTRAFEGARGSG